MTHSQNALVVAMLMQRASGETADARQSLATRSLESYAAGCGYESVCTVRPIEAVDFAMLALTVSSGALFEAIGSECKEVRLYQLIAS